MYVPNVFSPNEDGTNDVFQFYGSIALNEIQRFVVFDRWGKPVYREESIGSIDNLIGWNGKVGSVLAETGVYTYMIEADFIDGTNKVFSGDLLLLR